MNREEKKTEEINTILSNNLVLYVKKKKHLHFNCYKLTKYIRSLTFTLGREWANPLLTNGATNTYLGLCTYTRSFYFLKNCN